MRGMKSAKKASAAQTRAAGTSIKERKMKTATAWIAPMTRLALVPPITQWAARRYARMPAGRRRGAAIGAHAGGEIGARQAAEIGVEQGPGIEHRISDGAEEEDGEGRRAE